jgi:hypothetical protein
MPPLNRSLALYLRMPVNWLQTMREERRSRRRQATAELNMRRIDTEAFPMLREGGRAHPKSPPDDGKTLE